MNDGVPFSYRPITSYEAVYTYRSGRRAKLLNTDKAYSRYVNGGSNLHERMMRRRDYLDNLIRDILEPHAGNTKVFSTKDRGHPFATLKVEAVMPQYYVGYTRITTKARTESSGAICAMDTQSVAPDFSSVVPGAFRTGGINESFGLFNWPSSVVTTPAAVSQQPVSSTLRVALGTQLISSTNPWAPKASLAVTFLELMKGDVPRVVSNLIRHQRDLSALKRAAGSDYLNVQFGWVPLVRDLTDALEVAYKLDALMFNSQNYRRGREREIGYWNVSSNDPPISAQRQMKLAGYGITSSLESKIIPDQFPSSEMVVNVGSGGFIAASRYVRSSTTRADLRFTARFHRGVEASTTQNGYLDRAVELLGLEMTPAVLWELTSWSWLIDWFSNLGNVAKNLSDLDWSNVLLDYAYLTVRVRSQRVIGFEGITAQSSGSYNQVVAPTSMYKSVTVDELSREQASPFGFSTSWGGLSPYQLSILAALGMTRGR